MRTRGVIGVGTILFLCFTASVVATVAMAHDEVIDFESGRWVLANAVVVEHLGRKCLAGTAYLDGVEFEDGVIEVDIAVDGRSSYPGINFRIQSPGDYERVYFRPHRAGLYPDAIQYTPVINNIAGWQLYSGRGFTAGVELPQDEWIHVRMEVSGTQARVYVGDADEPALVIDELKHGASSGTLGLMCPQDETAYFSNFTYRTDEGLEFRPWRRPDTAPGIVSEWFISRSFKATEIDLERHPDEQGLSDIEWQMVMSEPGGLVDVARYTGRSGREPDCVFAKTVIESDEAGDRKFLFGYSDWLAVFLNGRILFSANSAYRHRDPSFLGIIGLNDAVYLPLEKGRNEVLLIVAEGFGGWGFMCQDGEAVFELEGVVKAWESDGGFKMPECVVYDSIKEVFYVSNYDAYNPSNNEGRQSISRISADGDVDDLDWVGELANPTGMAVSQGKLFVVERADVAEIDTESGEIVRTHPLPAPGFPNDIAIDAYGNMYVSDSRRDAIYKSTAEGFSEWVVGGEIDDPNGLCLYEGELVVGNNGDGSLKAIDLASGATRTIAELSPGVIDGIKSDGSGRLMVSHWEGRIYRIGPSGEAVRLLDTSVVGFNCADFEYVAEKDLIVIPTFLDNRIIAYTIR